MWVYLYKILSALLNCFIILCLIFYVELWSSDMSENSWQFFGSTRNDTDQKGFVRVNLDRVSFGFLEQRFCWVGLQFLLWMIRGSRSWSSSLLHEFDSARVKGHCWYKTSTIFLNSCLCLFLYGTFLSLTLIFVVFKKKEKNLY